MLSLPRLILNIMENLQEKFECRVKVINRSTSKLEFARVLPDNFQPSQAVTLARLLVAVIPNTYSSVEFVPYDCGDNK